MLCDAADVMLVAGILESQRGRLPLVVDPVMTASSGRALLEYSAIDTLKQRLVPLASLLTPNVPEAEVLTGMRIVDRASMRKAAEALLALGASAVLLKGGHLPGHTVVDLLATHDGIKTFEFPRIDTPHTHGTGCTLASAVAAGLAHGMGLQESVQRARIYVQAAIAAAPGFGAGRGPLNHAVTVDPGRLGALPHGP
jgi:hydroxymethylpyrimidine/phosphomethylpyrimidine kinase